MKAIILAGGLGTRICEETHLRPKPMIEIGGKPILWHILKIFSRFGVKDFIICCGYKGYVIKEYFANYFLHTSDVTFHMQRNSMTVHRKQTEDWNITLVDTGDATMTGGRLKRVREYIGEDQFMFTYGDGVADIRIDSLIDFHNSHPALVTVTAVQPPGRYGSLRLSSNGEVLGFQEKPEGDGSWINGGFFVAEAKALDYISSDTCVWEQGPMNQLVNDHQLRAYQHQGFWQPMDTLRDKNYLDQLWLSNQAPWKVWR